MRRVTCTNHCTGCGRHFHSLEAFDAHHVGDFMTDRHCESPLDILSKAGETRLTPLTQEGACELLGKAETPVTIWTMAGSRERTRAVWGSAA